MTVSPDGVSKRRPLHNAHIAYFNRIVGLLVGVKAWQVTEAADTPSDKDNVLPCERKPRTKVAASATSTEDCDPHLAL
jgi:hypothetical protein